ncbi:MAG: enoyl-CoA hydratase/isomerase family protein [Desulfatiglandales bacterium]
MRYINAHIRRGLGTITLNRAPLNILNIEMMSEINDTLTDWIENRDLRVVLLNANGKCFSSGVDVAEHMGGLVSKMIESFHGMFRLMDRLGAVTVSSVHGSCLGGGCELSIFCDLVIADDTARFGQPEIQLGVLPPIAVQIMPRIIGRKAAVELILSGRIVSAQEAMDMGLINKVVAKGDLTKETDRFIRPYLSLSAEVIRVTKKAIKRGLMDDLEPSLRIIEDIYLNELMMTADAQEGLQAFLDRRSPNWKNC